MIGQSLDLVLPALRTTPALASGDPARIAVPPAGLRLGLEARRRDGTPATVELSLSPIDANEGGLILCRLVEAPIASSPAPSPPPDSEPPDVRHLALLRDEYLAMLAHELRTPLHSMLGWAQLARRTPREPAMTERALEAIERNIRWQAQVIENLIDLADILFGQIRLETRPVHVAPIVDAALERVAGAAHAKDVRLLRSLVAEDIEILADPERFEHVIRKLISNGLRFTPAGGEVEVRAEAIGDRVQITVRDTGQGIDPVLLPRIFDSVRLTDESMRAPEWAEPGLSIIRSMVEMQGGNIRASSAGLGQGASFVISLPRAMHGADAASPSA